MVVKLKQWLEKEKKDILICIAATFILGLAAHAFAFFGTSFSHDSLNAFYATGTELNWKIELGRFIVPLYYVLFRGRFALPWVIGFLSLSFVSISVYLIKKMFGIKSVAVTAIIAGIMTTNLALIAQTGTYIYELDFNMLALMCAVGAAFLWKKQFNIGGLIGAVILLFTAMGIYQSYVTVTIGLIMAESIYSLLENERIKRVIMRALAGVGVTAAAFGLYLGGSKLACRIAGVALRDRTTITIGSLSHYKEMIRQAYLSFFEILKNKELYGISNTVILYVAIGLIVYIFLYIVFFDKTVKIENKVLAGLTLALLPLGMNSIYIIIHTSLHDLMSYGVWMFFVFFIVFVYKFAGNIFKKDSLNSIIIGLSTLIVAVLIWENIILANTLYLKKDTEAKATLSVMTRVVSEMESFEGYEMGITPIAFVGVHNPYKGSEGFERYYNITGAEKDNAIHSDGATYFYNPYKAYFNYVLNYPVNFCSDSEISELKNNPAVKEMPSFPEKGSIQYIDGVMVIKMG